MVRAWMRSTVVLVFAAACAAVSEEIDDEDDEVTDVSASTPAPTPAPEPAPEPTPEPDPAPPRSPEPADDACHDLDEPCGFEGDCCIHPEGALVCVGDERGGASCRAACEGDEDCDSGCCVALHDGASACLDASECAHDCAPLGNACALDAECCDGSQCLDGQCAARCDDDGSCPTGCCDASGTCAPAEHCGGESACVDGTYFCSEGRDLFECDSGRWYGFDCEVACIEAGWDGSTGCQWSELWEGDACVCSVG